VGADDEGLVLGVADAADAQAALHLGQVVVELRAKLGVLDVVDEAAEVLGVLDCQPPALGSQMGVEVGSIEEIEDAVLLGSNAEHTAHETPPLLSSADSSRTGSSDESPPPGPRPLKRRTPQNSMRQNRTRSG
jgi:hypothetical protein